MLNALALVGRCLKTVATTPSTLTGACQVAGSNVATLLIAVVNFDDNKPGTNPASPNCTSSANQSTCGYFMSMVSWKAQ